MEMNRKQMETQTYTLMICIERVGRVVLTSCSQESIIEQVLLN